MTKLLYLVLLAAIVWGVGGFHVDNDEDKDIVSDSIQSHYDIRCGRYYAQYPNPEDCTTYIVCQNRRKYIKSCGSGQHYSDTTLRCEEPCKAYCNKTLSCQCDWSTCGRDDVCFLPRIVGGCRDRYTRYYFDKRTGQCEKFKYSGCRGNENNFGTLEECQQKCRKEEPKPIPSFSCLRKNGRFPNEDNCRTFFQCIDWNPHLMACSNGHHYSYKTQRCEKPCDANCDKSLACSCKWPTCGLDELCSLLPETGPCRASFRNYYFNRTTGQCEKFIYGGCEGNENNFQKKEECEKACPASKPIPRFICLTKNGRFPNPDNCQTFYQCSEFQPRLTSCPEGLHFSYKSRSCEKPCDAYCEKSLSCECEWPTCGLDDLCFQPAEIGNCRAGIARYYFNRTTGQCEKFYWGGCNAKENNFKEKEECEKACSKEKPKPKPIPSFQCLKMEGLFPNEDNCRTYFQCIGGKPQLRACPDGLHYSYRFQRCVKPCEANCDKSLECECKWPTCGLDKKCFYYPEVGPCRAGFYKYYFNRTTGICEKFLWGGCRGNDNKFEKKEECEKACSKDDEQECPPGETWSENNKGCETTCKTVGKDVICPRIAVPGCICDEPGTVRGPDGSCIPAPLCPADKDDEEECPPGETWSENNKGCETTCKTVGKDVICPRIAVPGCVCDEPGTVRGPDGSCIPAPLCPADKVDSQDVCKLPAKTGTCKGKFERFFFNSEEGRCETFTYGGCNGNDNNFNTLEECETSCKQNLFLEETEDFTCVQDGLYKDPKSCSSYIHCVNGKKYDMPCPTGYHFNEKTKLCEEPSKAQCQESENDTRSEAFCTEDGMRPDFESCSRYIKCSNGQREIASCPRGLHFNEATNECDSPCDSRCDESLAMECGWPVGGEQEDDFECSENGRFMDPNNCGRYIQCSDGQTSYESCPRGLHFNEASQKCDSPCEARCNTALAFRCGWPVASETKTAEEKGQKQKDCPAHEHYDQNTAACQANCTTYERGHPCPFMVQSGCICDEGYVRERNNGKCIRVSECQNSEEKEEKQCPAPDGKFPYPGNERKYIWCRNGSPTIEQCPGYQLFDYIRGECVHF